MSEFYYTEAEKKRAAGKEIIEGRNSRRRRISQLATHIDAIEHLWSVRAYPYGSQDRTTLQAMLKTIGDELEALLIAEYGPTIK